MKILMVCEGITPSSIVAQPWKHVFELSRRLINQGNYVEILTSVDDVDDANKGLTAWDEIEGVPIIRVKKGKFFFNNQQLLKYLNDKSLDVINWHGSDVSSTIHLWRIRKSLRNNNVIWTLHSGPLSIGDLMNLKFIELIALHNFWNNILNALCPSFILKKWLNTPQIRGIITLSQRLKTYLIENELKKEDEVRVIRSGVDVERYRLSFKQKLMNRNNLAEFYEDGEIVLYFGPLSPFRGVDTLLRAMREIKKRIPSVKLLLLAREVKEEFRWLEKEALRMDGVSLIKGVLREENLIDYLGIADVVALPFRFWPQVECPLTLLEAMAMEKPVVTTRVGAIPEVIHDHINGILVPPNDHKILAKAIIELLNNIELAEKIGKNARRDIENSYTWDVIIKETIETFNSYLNRR